VSGTALEIPLDSLDSVRMLRHFDEIGLLRPDRVDPNTNYRLCAPSQIERLGMA
jgi:DNA-binding transcriptional MerR regulator